MKQSLNRAVEAARNLWTAEPVRVTSFTVAAVLFAAGQLHIVLSASSVAAAAGLILPVLLGGEAARRSVFAPKTIARAEVDGLPGRSEGVKHKDHVPADTPPPDLNSASATDTDTATASKAKVAQRHWAEHLKLSHHGAAFIAGEEGVRLRPYYDSRHIVTTGVGHVITPQHTTITSTDVRKWSFPSTTAAVNYFRNHDVVIYENAVRSTLGKASITQAQYDMCVSLCFNIGVGGFRSSRVARYIKAGKRRSAALAFLGWANPKVLLGRRRREMTRFLLAHW